MLVNGASINAVAQYFYTISRLQTRFDHSVTVCDRQRNGKLLVTAHAGYPYIHPLLPKKLFLHCHREISLVREVLPDKLLGTDYMRSTQCSQACGKTWPKTSAQASQIAISKAAHLAASTKMENRELEHRLQRIQNAPVNHRQLAQALHTIPTTIFSI